LSTSQENQQSKKEIESTENHRLVKQVVLRRRSIRLSIGAKDTEIKAPGVQTVQQLEMQKTLLQWNEEPTKKQHTIKQVAVYRQQSIRLSVDTKVNGVEEEVKGSQQHEKRIQASKIQVIHRLR
jgi:hypothetical protein